MGARHRVAAQEGKPILLGQGEDACTDLLFGARAVNDQRGLVQQRGQAGHVLHHRFWVGGQQKQIQALEFLVGEFPVDGLGDLGELHDGVVRVPAQDGHGLVPLKGFGQRASDEAQADDTNGHSFIASRMRRMRPAVCLNSSGVRDWAPSHRAWGGSLWTSIIMPSAPAAAAAMAIGSTR